MSYEKNYKETAKELSNTELIHLGKIYANYIKYIVSGVYEPWEFTSEDMPDMIQDGIECGIVVERTNNHER